MAYSYTTRSGQRVQVTVAAAFDNLAAAFKAATGLNLLVTSGTRTRAEQQHLYNLYRAGKGNLAAVPGTSNHEENGPTGPRALDVRDSGAGDGVTVAGNSRSNWLRANASRFGFNPAGYGFKRVEPWHIEYTGSLNNTPAPQPTLSGNSGNPNYPSRTAYANIQGGYAAIGYNLGKYGKDGREGATMHGIVSDFQRKKGLPVTGVHNPATEAALIAAQPGASKPAPAASGRYKDLTDCRGLQKIAKKYGYKGKIDNIWGSGSEAGFNAFLATQGGLAAWLRKRWGYVGNDIYGPTMRRSLVRANDENFKAL